MGHFLEYINLKYEPGLADLTCMRCPLELKGRGLGVK